MNYSKIACVVVVVMAMLSGCVDRKSESDEKEVNPIVKDLQHKYAPDKRTAIFDVSIDEMDGRAVVKGEVDDSSAKRELLQRAKNTYSTVTDSVEVLPSENLGRRIFGIVIVSVANMRTDPREGAELGTQVLLGTVVKVWKKGKGYYYVQTPDKYLGWIDSDQLQRVTKSELDKWNSSKKLFVRTFIDYVRQKPNDDAYPVCDVTGGGILKEIGSDGQWYKVGLADDRTGFIKKSSVMDYSEWGTTLHPIPANIERTGRFLMGVPYLWGGTSVKGVDCSGFTKTVFLLNGQLLNRDANQQAEQGVAVEPGKNFENLHKGDLLFFGRKAEANKPERIVHVGIYLGNRTFIHSSGKVRISSFDPASDLFDEYNLKRFVRARRVIAESPTTQEVKLQ